MTKQRIAIGNDHGGYEYKLELVKVIESLGYLPVDVGSNGRESTDYPDFAEKVGQMVSSGEVDMGILICGTGIGMSIAANKIKGVRAALCWNPRAATLAREHNNANVLCLGARLIPMDECIKITKTFLTTPASKEERHIRRVNKIKMIEERNKICGSKNQKQA
ncbi:MAG: ribose 5-phosphate isomerase B [Actinobacteria bacterium]|nr:ribose 5-phosphate isomerase B [Actinomycetota bacterium]